VTVERLGWVYQFNFLVLCKHKAFGAKENSGIVRQIHFAHGTMLNHAWGLSCLQVKGFELSLHTWITWLCAA
jgi:hypothetical protein